MNKITFLFIIALIFTFSVSYPQDGVLDTTFDEDGKLYLHFDGYNESEMTAVLVQPDDMILAAGVSHNHGQDQQFFIIRCKGDGLFDENFGVGGRVESEFTGTPRLEFLMLQPDNKIIGSGYIIINSPNYHTKSFIVRYNADGTPDNGFGNNGVVINDDFRISTICLQSDGKIVVAAYELISSLSNTRLIRFKTDGTIDNDFGGNGLISTENIASGLLITGVKTDSKGKFIIIGQYGTDYDKDVVVARFRANGVLDPTFGNNGLLRFDEDDIDNCSSLKILNDDRILFYLSSYHFANYETIGHRKLIKFFSNGDYDADFGVDGRLDLEHNISALELQADGKILVGGGYDSGIYSNPVFIGMTRYMANGTPDTTFGVGGVVMTSAGDNTRGGCSAIALQSDGKIVAGATFSEAYLSSHPQTLLLKYNSRLLAQLEFSSVKSSFVVYPNPVNEVLNIDFTLNQSEVLSMDLYGSDGRKVTNLLKDQDFSMGFSSQQLDFPGMLAGGIYFLTVSNGKDSATFKIVK